ncbi:hypothetical protein UP84_27990, partial [Escherichia coli]
IEGVGRSGGLGDVNKRQDYRSTGFTKQITGKMQVIGSWGRSAEQYQTTDKRPRTVILHW